MQTFNSIERIYRYLVLTVAPLGILFLIGTEAREYFRLPDQPTQMYLNEAIAIVESGDRPLIQILDAKWNCSNLIMRHGKRWTTNIAIEPSIRNILIVAHFWGQQTCSEIQKKSIVGVLEPMGAPMYNDLKEHGMKFETFESSEQVLNLCTYCSRQYSLGQVIQIVGYISVLGLGTVMIRLYQRARSKKSLDNKPLPSQSSDTGTN